jgi:hypothetical protein
MSRQPAVIELGDQPVFIGGVEQSRRVQAVDQFSEPLETSHDLQRIPAFTVAYRGFLPQIVGPGTAEMITELRAALIRRLEVWSSCQLRSPLRTRT